MQGAFCVSMIFAFLLAMPFALSAFAAEPTTAEPTAAEHEEEEKRLPQAAVVLKQVGPWEIGGHSYGPLLITNSMVVTWIVALVIIVFAADQRPAICNGFRAARKIFGNGSSNRCMTSSRALFIGPEHGEDRRSGSSRRSSFSFFSRTGSGSSPASARSAGARRIPLAACTKSAIPCSGASTPT